MHPDIPAIPGYEIYPRKPLGEGGFAKVFLAKHKSFQLDVALKIMDSELAKDPEFCKRFLREGRICAKLGTHPHIMNIYDIGCVDDSYYFSMQLLTGPSLQDVLEKKASVESQILDKHPLELLRPIVLALGYAHRHGFVHRDIKPANILFDEDGEAMLSDFGIAKSFDQNTLSAAGAAIGTPAYMSPEQAQAAEELDGRSDIYSLGVVLFELLSGTQPYKSDTPIGTMLQHVNAPLPQLPEHQKRFQPLIDKLMAKDPAQRYSDSDELLVDFDRFLSTFVEGGGGGIGQILERCLSGFHQWRTPLIASVLIAALVPVGFWIFQRSGSPIDDPNGRVTIDEPAVRPGRSTSLDPEVVATIERLWSRAELFEAVGDLVAPPGSNALEVYEEILKIEPNHPEALRRKSELTQ
ncbi:MAG: serine/threonine-protein kinase [Granulosicoccus sp.]